MRYQGGKSKIAKPISKIINNVLLEREISNSKNKLQKQLRVNNRTFVSLFCGACSVESLVRGFDTIICNDSHEYLIEMLKGVQHGYELPNSITKVQYDYIKQHKNEDKILAGFVGFGCSFGGKWFGGYCVGGNRNYCDEGKRAIMKRIETLQNATFLCKDYRDVKIPDNSVVYCDPPYNGTTGYSNGKFNSDEFWEFARALSKKNRVFISEQTAPKDFVSIWEKPVTRTLDLNKSNQFKVTEKLFIYNGDKEIL